MFPLVSNRIPRCKPPKKADLSSPTMCSFSSPPHFITTIDDRIVGSTKKSRKEKVTIQTLQKKSGSR